MAMANRLDPTCLRLLRVASYIVKLFLLTFTHGKMCFLNQKYTVKSTILYRTNITKSNEHECNTGSAQIFKVCCYKETNAKVKDDGYMKGRGWIYEIQEVLKGQEK